MKDKLLEIINTIQENRNRELISSIKREDILTEDLGLESLDLAELTVRIEAEFDVDIFEDDIILSVGEILDKLGDE